MKILDTIWYCGRSNVGIVRTQNYNEIKYYIGSPPGGGVDEAGDQQWIADWGSTFSKRAGDALFGVSE